MSGDAEERLREAIVALEIARDEQAARRAEAERMVDALMALAERGSLEETFRAILRAFSFVIEASDALIITFSAEGRGIVAAATSPAFEGTTWPLGPTFARALERGQPIASFDAAAMPEWQAQPEAVLERSRSALLVPLVSGELGAILALVHASPAAFDAGHRSLARRLIPAAQKAIDHARADAALREAREAGFRREIQEKADFIEQQRAAIQSLSTPIVEVGPEVLCLPVVGFLDEGRSAQILARVLEAVRALGARAVIIDVTGLDRIDPDSIASLVRIAGATRLLGAACVLTGVRPEVARMIAAMGLDTSAMLTFPRVRDALAHLARLR